MSSRPVIVAIDGPAGSGKSSVSRAVARRLGWAFLDTGAAYRALAWFALDRSVDTDDADAVIALLPAFDYGIGTEPDGYHVRVGEADVTEAIREPRVASVVSAIARIPQVRSHLVDCFRRIAAAVPRPGVVIEGRDITTVVAPDAPVRILLTADEAVRMARRSAELSDHAADTVARQLAQRDRADSQVVDFMNAADGVTTVDSTRLNFDETVDAVIAVIEETA
ncbi:(d)CMP kinase [Rathayibacter sp. YIM 133350]|uniref:(d)CMP kinase n=1 Tax=Rathayibacter sp. YIM 133350 TaxID=3131992 RepID=UPI00307DF26B